MPRKQVATAQNKDEGPSSGIIHSGITVKVKRKKVDILDLTDEHFLSVLYNTLKTFNFDGHEVSNVLVEKTLRTYLTAIRNDPSSTPFIRVSAIMTFEEMGKCFEKDEAQWDACLKHFGFTREVKNQKDKR